jgi:two-component system cell cycle response regulator DivK
VRQAADGRGLLARVQTEQPGLILLDLQLPGVNGFTLARQLTTDPATRHIPLLAMSAYARPEEEAQAMAAGCAGFLAKPLNTRALVVTVSRLLGQ